MFFFTQLRYSELSCFQIIDRVMVRTDLLDFSGENEEWCDQNGENQSSQLQPHSLSLELRRCSGCSRCAGRFSGAGN